jgi:hypothetical protein
MNRRGVILGVLTAGVGILTPPVTGAGRTEKDILLDIFDRMSVVYHIEPKSGRIAIFPDGDNVTGQEKCALELTFTKAGRLDHIGLWYRDDIHLLADD